MNGKQLKEILRDNDISGNKLANIMGLHSRTVYEWYRSEQPLKKHILDKIVKATKLPDTLFKVDIDNIIQDSKTHYGLRLHHGKNIKDTITNNGITITAFARKMKLTRQTVHAWFELATWDEGELFKAAGVLQVPIAQLKGKGTGPQSFEKDIYLELKQIKETLQAQNELLKRFTN